MCMYVSVTVCYVSNVSSTIKAHYTYTYDERTHVQTHSIGSLSNVSKELLAGSLVKILSEIRQQSSEVGAVSPQSVSVCCYVYFEMSENLMNDRDGLSKCPKTCHGLFL